MSQAQKPIHLAITNFSGPEYPSLGNDLGSDFGSTLSKVKAIARKRGTNWMGLTDMAVTNLFLWSLPYDWMLKLACGSFWLASKRGFMPNTFTNGGIIYPESVTFGTRPVSVRPLTSTAYPPRFLVTMTGYGGSLTLSATVYPTQKDIVNRFLGRVLAELPA